MDESRDFDEGRRERGWVVGVRGRGCGRGRGSVDCAIDMNPHFANAGAQESNELEEVRVLSSIARSARTCEILPMAVVSVCTTCPYTSQSGPRSSEYGKRYEFACEGGRFGSCLTQRKSQRQTSSRSWLSSVNMEQMGRRLASERTRIM